MARSAKRQASESVDGRTAFMMAVRELLSEHNGSRFSLAEVAARAGRNIALVSYYFGGKEQMLIAVLKDDEDAFMVPLRALVASDLPADHKLERHLSAWVDMLAKRPYLNVLIHELLRRSGPEIGEDIANRFVRPTIELQAQILAQGEREGLFRKLDPFVFYLNVMGGIDMLFSARSTIEFGFGRRMNDAATRASFVKDTLSLVLHGALAAPAGPGKPHCDEQLQT
jgi:AcrR family transcriptional regulator